MGWLSGWLCRNSHVINPASGAGTGYQVLIKVYKGEGTNGYESVEGFEAGKVYCGGYCRDDFGDIRFTASDGTTLLNHWLWKKAEGSWALFWVKINDDLSSTARTIYVYYNKPDATSASNGNNTFNLFDDFEDGVVDTSKWTIVGPNVSESLGSLRIQGRGGWNQDGVASLASFDRSTNGYVFYFYTKVSTTDFDGMSGYSPYPLNYSDGILFYFEGTNKIYRWRDNAGAVLLSSYAAQTWYGLCMKLKQGQGYRLLIDGVEKEVDTAFADNNHRMAMNIYENGQIEYYDYIFVKKYVEPEPSHGAWGEREWAYTYATADLPGQLQVRVGGTADLAGQLAVRAQGVPRDLLGQLFVGIKGHVIYGTYDFPGVQRVERVDTDLFVEKPIPGRQKAYRAAIGALGRICRIEGIAIPADVKAFIAELEGLADGQRRWFYDGLTHAYRAIMRRPRFRLSADRPGAVEYEAEFAEQDNP